MSKTFFATDEGLVSALKNGDSDALQYVYKTYWPMISRFVRCNNGRIEDAEELYQEGIITLYEKLRSADFTLTCSIKTYIYSVCRNKWLYLLKGRKVITDIEEYEVMNLASTEDAHELPEDKEIVEAIIAMGDPCHTLLIGFYYQQLSLDVLAEKLKYASASVAKQQKFRCVERLKKVFLRSEYKYSHE